jgi:ABC-type multidrug transport system permease subunit
MTTPALALKDLELKVMIMMMILIIFFFFSLFFFLVFFYTQLDLTKMAKAELDLPHFNEHKNYQITL